MCEDVVVDQRHRGKGLARSLMDGLAREAKLLGCYKAPIASYSLFSIAYRALCRHRGMARRWS